MILLIDTTKDELGKQIVAELNSSGKAKSYDYIDAADMNISHCVGCNFCW